MKKIIIAAALAASTSVHAQEVAPATAPLAPAPAAVAIVQTSTDNVLRAGTEIPLILREELTTKKKKLRVGQRFQMEVAEGIRHNGVVIIPSGTPAVGEITEVRNKGMWGKSGYIGARVVSLNLNGRHVRLTGTFDDKGVTGTAGVVGAVALIPIAGFFTTGTSAMIASGSGTKAFLDEDLTYVRPAPPPPIVLPTPVESGPVVQAITQ